MFESMAEFEKCACDSCRCKYDLNCTDCDWIRKAKQYPIERINKAFDECGEHFGRLRKRVMKWK